jgi:dipeptidyl aminopeptidase/acylaminoacyl peptidase
MSDRNRPARSHAGAVLAFLLTFWALPGLAQNGRLLETVPIKLPEEDLVRIEKRDPAIRSWLSGIEVQAITYESDGLKVKGYMAAPKEGTRLPVVIWNRGGSRDFGQISDVSASVFLGRIAQWGYVVLASQYRGVAGGEGKEEFGGAEVADILSLLPLIDALPKADPTRVGMYGWSRGGMMTYLALTRTDRIAAAVVGAGPADLFDLIQRRPEMETVLAELVPGYAEKKNEALTSRSAILWPEKLHKKTPILLLQGSADWRVHPQQALRMAESLYKVHHPFRLVFFEGGDHGLFEHQAEVDRLAKDWLDRYVRDRQPWPSLEPHGN